MFYCYINTLENIDNIIRDMSIAYPNNNFLFKYDYEDGDDIYWILHDFDNNERESFTSILLHSINRFSNNGIEHILPTVEASDMIKNVSNDTITNSDIKNNPCLLQFIDKPSYECFTAALSRDPRSIIYLKSPSDDIIDISLTQDPYNIRFIRNIDHDICIKSIKHGGIYPLKYIPDNFKTDELCLRAIEIDSYNMNYIGHRSDSFYIKALQLNPSVKKYLNHMGNEFETMFKEHIKTYEEGI